MNDKFTLTTILNTVCDHYQLEKSDVCSKSRKEELVKARKMFCYFSREFSDLTFEKIGEFVNLGHDTAMFHNTDIKLKKDTYKDLTYDIKEITSILFREPRVVVKDVNLCNNQLIF